MRVRVHLPCAISSMKCLVRLKQHSFSSSLFVSLPSWLYNWGGQLSCVCCKMERTRQRVRTLWLTGTYVTRETGTARTARQRLNRREKMRGGVWKGKVELENGREKNVRMEAVAWEEKESRCIMKMWISWHFRRGSGRLKKDCVTWLWSSPDLVEYLVYSISEVLKEGGAPPTLKVQGGSKQFQGSINEWKWKILRSHKIA